MKKLSVTLSGHRTSISIEYDFFDALRQIAKREKTTVAKIIERIDNERDDGDSNLSSALRVWVLRYLRRITKL